MPQGSRILIVEDNAALRKDLKEFLELAGYRVRAAADGGEALALLAKEMADAIVSDYEMPNMNGEMLRETLRSKSSTARLPFIMISGGIPPRPHNDPAYWFLNKPISVDELITSMEQLIALHSISVNARRIE